MPLFLLPLSTFSIIKTSSSLIDYCDQTMTSKDQKPAGAMSRGALTKNIKPFNCKHPKCPSKGFKTFGSKQRHERELHGTNKKCEHCDFTAKRRYQIDQHIEEAHPDRIVGNAADISANRASRCSIDSYSSDGSASGTLQHVGRLALQRLPATQQSLPNYTSFNTPQVYTSSNVGINQHPVGPSYAADTYNTFFSGDYHTPSSSPSDHTQSHNAQPSYSTTSRRDPVAQSSGTPWGAAIIPSRPILSSLSYTVHATMNPPDQLDYAISPRTPYHSGNNRDMHYDVSPYSSPSSEQGTSYTQSTGSSHIGETGQQSYWSEQPPTEL